MLLNGLAQFLYMVYTIVSYIIIMRPEGTFFDIIPD